MSVEVPLRHRRGNRKMMYLVEQYKKAHPEESEEVEPHLVAPWAIKKDLWKRPPVAPEEVLRRLISRALRQEYMEDPQGREVRKHHPVIYEVVTPDGVKKRSKWFPLFEAPPKHMTASLSLRRRSALADVLQLKLDFDSYNDNNVHGATLPEPDFDFNKDIEEMSLPSTYPEQHIDDLEEDENDEDKD
jgi:hypothetical protein